MGHFGGRNLPIWSDLAKMAKMAQKGSNPGHPQMTPFGPHFDPVSRCPNTPKVTVDSFNRNMGNLEPSIWDPIWDPKMTPFWTPFGTPILGPSGGVWTPMGPMILPRQGIAHLCNSVHFRKELKKGDFGVVHFGPFSAQKALTGTYPPEPETPDFGEMGILGFARGYVSLTGCTQIPGFQDL